MRRRSNDERDKRVVDLVEGGATYTTAGLLSSITRNVVSGIMFRHNNPGFKSKWRKKPLRKLIRFAGAEVAAL